MSVSWVAVSILIYLALGIVNYSTAFFAQYFGNGQNKKIGFLFWQTLYVSILIAGICAAFIPVMPFLFRLLGRLSNESDDPQYELLLKAEVNYAQIMLAGTIGFLTYEIGSSLFSGVEMPAPIIAVNLISLIANAGLDYLLIHTFDLGYRGAAYATLSAKAFGTLLFLGILLFYKPRKVRRRFRFLLLRNARPSCRQMRQCFVVGLGMGFIRSLELIAWTFFMFLLQIVGTNAVTGAGYAMSVHDLAALFVYGISAAEGVVAALYMGDNDPKTAASAAVTCIKFLGIYEIGITLLYNLVPQYLLYPFALEEGGFTDPASVAALKAVFSAGVMVLHCYTPFAWGEMLQMCLASLLGASGDTFFPALMSFAGCVLGIIVPGIVLGCVAKGLLSALSITLMLAANVWVSVVPLFISAVRGRWRSRRLIQETSEKSADTALEAQEGEERDRKSVV